MKTIQEQIHDLENRSNELEEQVLRAYHARRPDYGYIHATQAEVDVLKSKINRLRKQLKEKHMEIKYNEKGQAKGRACVACTIASMNVGDVWETTAAESAKDSYIRVCATRLGKTLGRTFTVRARVENHGVITITRTA